jgi:hypothetical protein
MVERSLRFALGVMQIIKLRPLLVSNEFVPLPYVEMHFRHRLLLP